MFEAEGISVDNFDGGKHISGGIPQGFRLHLHRGDQGIDTWSPEVPEATWQSLQETAAAGTLAQLDAAGAAAWPSWWPQNVHGRPGGLQAVKLLLS